MGVKQEEVLWPNENLAVRALEPRHGWARRETRNLDLIRSQEMSRHVVGQPLQTFMEPDPDEASILQFDSLTGGPKGNSIRREFLKWVENRREAMFEGRNDVGSFIEWRETLEYYFFTASISDQALQFWLATLTFRKAAMRWWGMRAKQYPRLVLSFAQLVEWIRAELVPCTNPEEAMVAW